METIFYRLTRFLSTFFFYLLYEYIIYILLSHNNTVRACNKIFVYIIFSSTLKYNAFEFKKILFFPFGCSAPFGNILKKHYNNTLAEIDIAKRIVLCAQFGVQSAKKRRNEDINHSAFCFAIDLRIIARVNSCS